LSLVLLALALPVVVGMTLTNARITFIASRRSLSLFSSTRSAHLQKNKTDSHSLCEKRKNRTPTKKKKNEKERERELQNSVSYVHGNEVVEMQSEKELTKISGL
jgi:hypothetical protein